MSPETWFLRGTPSTTLTRVQYVVSHGNPMVITCIPHGMNLARQNSENATSSSPTNGLMYTSPFPSSRAGSGNETNNYCNIRRVIFCKRKETVSAVYEYLKVVSKSSYVTMYHASISDETKEAVYSAFVSGCLYCLVSTIAFGMVGSLYMACDVHVHVQHIIQT